MILVDTSVWIEFFKKREPIFSGLREQIEAGQVLAHSLVFAELLQGCRDPEEAELLQDYWEALSDAESSDGIVEGGMLSFKNKFYAKGIGLVDAVLVSECRRRKVRLWTLDKALMGFLDPKEHL
jgi:predicted nucleic acid-binding protein